MLVSVRIRWIALFAVFLMLPIASSEAQSDGVPIWRVLTRADGLGSSVVRQILEDPNGNLWFATGSGLTRFDGLWETFTRTDGLASSDVRALVLAPDGTLWAATAAGVSQLERSPDGQWTVLPPTPGLPPTEVFDLAVASDGEHLTVWAGTRIGLFRWTPESWEHFTDIGFVPIRVVAANDAGVLWCVRDGGPGEPAVLIRVDRFDAPAEEFPLPARDNLVRVNDLLSFGGNQWWIGTPQGILFYDGSWWGPAAPPGHPPVNAFARDADGTIWIATEAGLFRFDGTWQRIDRNDGLPSDSVLGAIVDGRARLWVATTNGVALSDGSWARFGTAEGLPSGSVSALASDLFGRLWIGTENGLVRRDALGWHVFTSVDGLPGDRIEALALDESGRVWVGTSGIDAGLAVPTADGWQVVRAPEGIGEGEVYSLTFGRSGDLWVGTGFLRLVDGAVDRDFLGTVSRFDGARWERWRTDATPVALAEDEDGTLWIGTRSRGLLRLVDGRIEEEPLPLPAEVRALLRDSAGVLWVGTSEGLFRRQGEEWREFGVADGLPGHSVRALAEDNAGRLWVGLDEGIAQRIEGDRWVRFTPEDGLPEGGVRAIAATLDGSIWFGGPEGVGLLVHRRTHAAPETRFVSAPTGVLGEPAVLVEFTGGDARTPSDQLRFSVRINGGEWSPPQFRPELLLDSLPDGETIVLEVRAVDRDGNPDPTPARTVFRVDTTPPTAEIFAPAPGEVVRGVVSIRGNAFDRTDFDRYRILFPAGPPYESDEPVQNGILAEWDTRRVPDGPATLRLIAFDRREGPFDTVHTRTQNLTVVVDNTPPAAELLVPPGRLAGRVELRASLADENLAGYRLSYRQPGVAVNPDWVPIRSGTVSEKEAIVMIPWLTSNVDGPAELRLEAFDAAGNVTAVSTPIELDNPSARPFVEIATPRDGDVLSGTFTVIGTVRDETLAFYEVAVRPAAGGDWVVQQRSTDLVEAGPITVWDTTTLPDGDHFLRIRAQDENGYETVQTVRVRIDNTTPSPTILLPSPNTTFRGNGPIDIVARVEEANAATYTLEYRLVLEIGDWEPISAGRIETNGRIQALWSPNGLDGPVELRLTVTDAAGNTSETLLSPILLDASAPHVRIDEPADGALVTGRVAIRGTVLDENLASFEIAFRAPPGEWVPIPSVVSPGEPPSGLLAEWETATLEGETVLRLRAADRVGLEAETSIVVTVDNTPPTVAIADPVPNSQVAGLVEIVGTATDAHLARYWLEVDGERVGDPMTTDVTNGVLGVWNAAEDIGAGTLRLVAEDRAGHRSSVEVPLLVVAPFDRAEGGISESVRGDVRLRIPPNALPTSVPITINRIAVELGSGIRIVEAVQIEPRGLVFDPRKPATIAFRRPAGVEGRLGIVALGGGAPRWLGGSESNGWIRAPIDRLGVFALAVGMGSPDPNGDRPLRLRVQPRVFSPAGGRLPSEASVTFFLREPGQTSVRIYNGSGRRVRRLVDAVLYEGTQAFLWDGRDDAGRPLPNGVYIVQVQTTFARMETTVVIWNP